MSVFHIFFPAVSCNFLQQEATLRTRLYVKTPATRSSRRSTASRSRTPQNFDGLYTCVINETIDNEDYVLKSTVNTSVFQFLIFNQEDVKFLPKEIGRKFPNLKKLMVNFSALLVVRNFYFNKMYYLKYLDLNFNKITLIDSGAFKDLVNVNELHFEGNLIETLEENLFLSMVNLAKIYLNRNRIKFLKPTTFKIHGGELINVDLKENLCINTVYLSENLTRLESDLRVNCAVIFL